MAQETRIVKACPECLRTFPVDVNFCGLCGLQLVQRTVTDKLSSMPNRHTESSYIGTRIDDRYLVKKLIGRGGMGSVFLVEQIHMQRQLAMKLLHEDLVVRKQLVSRFTREARAISRLSNPHTVRVYDFGRHEALFYLVMEYLQGVDLEVILSQEGALDWRRSLILLNQICESLEEAHERGIVHRDLKPENIMIIKDDDGNDFVKVLDFGLAKIRDSEDVFSVHSHRDLFGTPFYMAPEQIRQDDLDHRADIYSLGCLLYRMLCNAHAFDAPYAFDVLRQHLNAPIPSVKRSSAENAPPERVDRLVRRLLAKRPEHRFADMTAMRKEIVDCLNDPDGQAEPLPSEVADAAGESVEIDSHLEARLKRFERAYEKAANVVDPPKAPANSVPKVVVADQGVGVKGLALGIPVEKGESTPGGESGVVHSVEDNFFEQLQNSAIETDSVDDERFEYVSEEDRYERRLKWRRRVRVGLGVTVLATFVFVAGLHYDSTNSDVTESLESEPNNTLTHADILVPDTPILAHVGKRISEVDSDRDLYRVDMGGAGRYLELELTAIQNMDLALDVLDPTGRPLTQVNYSGYGKGETLHRFRVESSHVFVSVSEATPSDQTPTENVSDHYILTAHVEQQLASQGELEPNDVAAAANEYKPGETSAGYLDGPLDVDYYRVVTDGVADLRRWSVQLSTEDTIVPRIALYRLVGDSPELVFSDQGRPGSLKTVYEEPSFPNPVYLLAVSHSGVGTIRGEYSLFADLAPSRATFAHERNDDRAHAKTVVIGQKIDGVLEDGRDRDVFAIPVTDPRFKEVEIRMDSVGFERARMSISDAKNINVKTHPRRMSGKERPPQPHLAAPKFKYTGDGETYYLTVSTRKKRARNVRYSITVRRILESSNSLVGGPNR